MKKIIKVIIIAIIIFIILDLCNNRNNEEKIINLYEKDNNIEINNQEIDIEKEKEVKWTENLKGYDVIAKLSIPNIDLETKVLSEYSKEALLISVVKFWGGEPNGVGNFCIAGHNYKRKNMFYNIKQLEDGDEIFLTDKYNTTITYIVYSITKVEPENISCISQNTDGKREITLITCTSDSKKRIIVKALEKDS